MKKWTNLWLGLLLLLSTADAAHGKRQAGLNNFDTVAPSLFRSNYFAYGYTDHVDASNGQDIKFQISVRTKLFKDLKSGLGWLNGIAFAYTQMSIFDINGRSAPFRATNYNPEILFVWDQTYPLIGFLIKELRLSLYDHHSTGVGAENSRRWERIYVQPAIQVSKFRGDLKIWIETPYKDGLSSQNEDIEEYLGHGELSIEYTHTDRLSGKAYLTSGKESDLNVRLEVSGRPFELDFFLFLQYYNGFGEELTGYNVETQSLRLGIRFIPPIP